MFRTAIERPAWLLRSAKRDIHVSRLCLGGTTTVSPTTSTPADPAASKERKKRTSRSRKEPKPDAEPAPRFPEKPVLSENRILLQLREMDDSGTITMGDLEHYRPQEEPPSLDSPEYGIRYQAIAKPLIKSFKKAQFANILALYGVKPQSQHQTKAYLAALLLEAWGWPPVRGSSSQRTLPMMPNEAFLVMNSEHITRLVRTNFVKLQFSPETSLLTITGSDKATEQIVSSIKYLKEDIAESAMFIPFKTVLPTSQLEAISRSTGGYVERLDDFNLRIYYAKTTPLILPTIKQALIRTCYENINTGVERSFRFEYAAGDGTSYSITPFVPIQTTFRAKGNPNTYRLSRSLPNSPEPPSSTNYGPSFDKLRRWLLPILDESSAPAVKIESIPGHQLFQDSEGSIFSPLFQETLKLQDGLERIGNTNPSGSVFYPFVPKGVYGISSSMTQIYQRMVYSQVPPISATSSEKPQTTPIIQFLVALDNTPGSLISRQYPELEHSIPSQEEGEETTFYGLCTKGWKRDADLLLPDGSVDMRFTVSQMAPQLIPPTLQNYLDHLNNRSLDEPLADPPLHFSVGSQVYVLTSSAVVRGGLKELNPDENPSLRLFTEVALFTESRQTESTCHVTSIVDKSDETWEQFVQRSAALMAPTFKLPTTSSSRKPTQVDSSLDHSIIY